MPPSDKHWVKSVERAVRALPDVVRLETLEVGDIWGAEFHTTPSHELIHVLQGSAEIRYRRRSFTVGPGDTFVIPRGTPHRDVRADGPAYRVMYTFFRWPGGQELLKSLNPAAAESPAARTHFSMLARQLESEYLSESNGASERMQVILLELLLALARCSHRAKSPVSRPRRGVAEQRRKALAEAVNVYLAGHFAEAISLESLAERFDVSPFHLCRTYTQVFGVSMTDMVARLRIERAGGLLKGGASVKEAAAQSGFSDPNYFAKVFRKVTGMSPSEFMSHRER